MDDVQVLFDRTDRLYRFGDQVRGTMIINAAWDFTCSEVQISYSWRTHGRGDRDKGPESSITLSAVKIPLRKGEHREFPFRFDVPMGPVTYHGHKLNVDWYLTAYARRGAASALTCEEDFLLLGREPIGAAVRGNNEIAPDDFPRPSFQEMPLPSGLQELHVGGRPQESPWLPMLWTASIFGALFWAIFQHGPIIVWAYAIAATVIGILVIAFNANAYKRKLDVSEPSVEPGIVYPGGRVNCRLDFRVKQDVYLHSIEASIYAKEQVTFAQGTTSQTEQHEVSRRSFARTFDEQLSSGRSIIFECPLPVPADAPPSFKSGHNVVEWFVDLRVNLQGWPGLTRKFPITVLPEGYVMSV